MMATSMTIALHDADCRKASRWSAALRMYGKLTATIVTTAMRMEKPNPWARPAIVTAVSRVKISGDCQ